MSELTTMELAFLRSLAGGPQEWEPGVPMHWGAAMSAVIESLHGRRLITYPNVKLTDAGREAIRHHTGAQP